MYSPSLDLHSFPTRRSSDLGEESCFFNVLDEEKQTTHDVIHRIVQVIENRRQHPVEGAYTTYLFNEGIDKVLKRSEERRVGRECRCNISTKYQEHKHMWTYY